MRPETRGQEAVSRAKNNADYVVLSVTFVVFFLMSSGYFIIATLLSEEMRCASFLEGVFGVFSALIGGGIAFMAILLIGMFLIRMHRQTILGN